MAPRTVLGGDVKATTGGIAVARADRAAKATIVSRIVATRVARDGRLDGKKTVMDRDFPNVGRANRPIIHSVKTFESATEFLVADRQHFPCLIADYHMPNMTGLELTEQLRSDGANIQILLMTGSPTRAILGRAAEAGIDRVLQKAPSDKDLRRMIACIRGHWPRVEILLRGDSHYCTPEVLRFCRANRVDYALGVATTTTLRRHIDTLEQTHGIAPPRHLAG